MKKVISRIIVAILLLLFIGSVGAILFILKQYRDDEAVYGQAAQRFTMENDPAAEPEGSKEECAPIVVDFEALKKENEDVIGWIYCEDTVIDYPVLRGEDNDYYLHHTYDRKSSISGSIFVDTNNRPGFVDSNTVIYGHHMKNKSMFATISNWAGQEYYEEHPIMWLLTPEQDYKIVLFSEYTTSAYSDTYLMYQEPCPELNEYLKKAAKKSNFRSDAQSEEQLDGNARYVLLSTCAYVFDDARDVLHGKLVPVNSAGGVPVAPGEGAVSGIDAGEAAAGQ